ncbi:recombinase family protein [Candidatus Dojkabacteria bacterium]|uniref:Recombinase family protein n=1 Tax=Candidatus Dojkabacteria bacterium TaxID=2099670 RepID=A0A955L1W3_9BACT|nr:recombinase family protein [Candidatus Dojkabacteria bacterium]MCB0745869.1 recombinase family protein [Ignavibacteriota bacterium]MCB0752930.1 recombinase family protein [Ignavibacteriota bacterium]
MKKFVAYYRVSTQKQGNSGLGLQAQKNAVANHISEKGNLIGEFTEVETGTRKKKRVEIYRAIELAKSNKATLIVAKLDRLARDVEFTSALFNGGVDFICCDNPNANKLTIQLLSVIAEHEAEVISKRIKDALKVKKEKIEKGIYVNKDGSVMTPINGEVRLGNPNGFGEFQKLGVKKIKENANNNKNNIQAMDIICSARKEGMTFQAIADKLNKLQYTTRRGKKFNPIQVHRLFKKCED